MRTTETTCLSDELCLFKEEEEEDGQIVSLGVRDHLDLLNMLTVRVVVLEYSQLHKKERDAGIRAIPKRLPICVHIVKIMSMMRMLTYRETGDKTLMTQEAKERIMSAEHGRNDGQSTAWSERAQSAADRNYPK